MRRVALPDGRATYYAARIGAAPFAACWRESGHERRGGALAEIVAGDRAAGQRSSGRLTAADVVR